MEVREVILSSVAVRSEHRLKQKETSFFFIILNMQKPQNSLFEMKMDASSVLT